AITTSTSRDRAAALPPAPEHARRELAGRWLGRTSECWKHTGGLFPAPQGRAIARGLRAQSPFRLILRRLGASPLACVKPSRRMERPPAALVCPERSLIVASTERRNRHGRWCVTLHPAVCRSELLHRHHARRPGISGRPAQRRHLWWLHGN